MQYRNVSDGKPAGSGQMLLKTFAGGFLLVLAIFVLCMPKFIEICNAVERAKRYRQDSDGPARMAELFTEFIFQVASTAITVFMCDTLSALVSEHGQTLQEKIFGIALVYKPQAQVQAVIIINQ